MQDLSWRAEQWSFLPSTACLASQGCISSRLEDADFGSLAVSSQVAGLSTEGVALLCIALAVSNQMTFRWSTLIQKS